MTARDGAPAPVEDLAGDVLQLKVRHGGAAGDDGAGEPALDRTAVRRVWITLAVGGIGMAVLAISAWTFVTIVALMSAV